MRSRMGEAKRRKAQRQAREALSNPSASAGMPSRDLPDALFGPPSERDESCPDHPEVRRAVDWLKSFMSDADWRRRRAAAANGLYEAALGRDLDAKGRFFSEAETFAWDLF